MGTGWCLWVPCMHSDGLGSWWGGGECVVGRGGKIASGVKELLYSLAEWGTVCVEYL